MGALDDAMEEANRIGGHRNRLEVVLEEMNPEDAKKLLEVYLPDKRYSVPQIVRALRSLGYDINRSSVASWRVKHVN